MATTAPSWEDFLKYHLLRLHVVSGVVLMTHRGVVSYKYGNTSDIPQEEFKQFTRLFEKPSDTVEKTEFSLSVMSGSRQEKTHFKIYKKTYCSIYCASEGHASGLVICNLPSGILLSTYKHPIQSSVATKAIEAFCDRLRA